MRDPESFAVIALAQHRLSLGDSDYDRLTKRQQALAAGKPDPAFERHRLGRLFLEEGLRNANVDPNGQGARTARQQLDTLLGAFESVEGKPPTMSDIRRLLGDVLPRAKGGPAAGRDYLPDHPSHRKGLEEEYGLANDIARQFPDHRVIDFGRKAGQRGPDVVSVDRDGEVTFWDSKWCGSDTWIGPGGRAHQTTQSFEGAREHAKQSIRTAMASGRLSPEAGAKALENWPIEA